jgi:type VI secretion system protein ImpC
MGDFSGHSQREPLETVTRLIDRPLLAVDLDDLDAVLARLTPHIQLSLDGSLGAPVRIDFHTLDDFHPDALYQRLPLFQTLRQTRARLLDPATFAQAAVELSMAPAISNHPRRDQDKLQVQEDNAALIERLLGRRPLSQPQDRPDRVAGLDVNQFIRTLVQPHIVPAPDDQREQLLACVDLAISEQMRRVLHHPAFQALEAAWRGVYWLITALQTGEAWQLYLLDVTRQELLADLRAAGSDLQSSELYRLFIDKEKNIPGGQPWALLIGDYSFGPDPQDLALLTFLGALGAQAGGPFLAAARCEILGCRSLAETPDPAAWQPLDQETEQRWQTLRASPVAPWLGLALPRLLLRLPYGKQTDPIERFAFEEMASGRDHEAFLWGNPAFGCALLLSQVFLDSGWSEPLDAYRDLLDLPAYAYQEGGEAKLQPCAEVWLGERAAQVILNRGVMPLLSHRHRNAVRLLRWQSLADPSAALAGPWG